MDEQDTPLTNVVPMRGERGRFVKGTVNNPNGNNASTSRAKIKTGGSVAEMFRANDVLVYEHLLRLIVAKDTPAGARVSAIEMYYERGHGKPAITVQPATVEEYEGLDVSQLSTDVLAALDAAANGDR